MPSLGNRLRSQPSLATLNFTNGDLVAHTVANVTLASDLVALAGAPRGQVLPGGTFSVTLVVCGAADGDAIDVLPDCATVANDTIAGSLVRPAR